MNRNIHIGKPKTGYCQLCYRDKLPVVPLMLITKERTITVVMCYECKQDLQTKLSATSEPAA